MKYRIERALLWSLMLWLTWQHIGGGGAAVVEDYCCGDSDETGTEEDGDTGHNWNQIG